MSIAPAGTLNTSQLEDGSRIERMYPYLSQNTQRQLPCEVIAPPRGGPAMLDRAKIEATTPETGPIAFPGISVVIVIAML